MQWAIASNILPLGQIYQYSYVNNLQCRSLFLDERLICSFSLTNVHLFSCCSMNPTKSNVFVIHNIVSIVSSHDVQNQFKDFTFSMPFIEALCHFNISLFPTLPMISGSRCPQDGILKLT